jgi:hypothetical protein
LAFRHAAAKLLPLLAIGVLAAVVRAKANAPEEDPAQDQQAPCLPVVQAAEYEKIGYQLVPQKQHHPDKTGNETDPQDAEADAEEDLLGQASIRPPASMLMPSPRFRFPPRGIL